MSEKTRVLISCPNFYDATIFLPYIFGVLKLHCEENPTLKDALHWERPIFWSAEPEANLAPYDISKIDVLGLSVYAWNWLLQLELAKLVKAANPNCLVIAGGPHPHWSDPNFFKEHPQIDLIVKYDGEIVFEQIMLQKISETPDYTKIPGIIYPNAERIAVHTQGTLLRPTTWTDKSAFYDVPEMWDIANEIRTKAWIGAAWETNRGCPYHCTFCDWGSATHSKIRRLPSSKIQRDMQFFSEAKINHIFITDANFGLFEQDVELAKALSDRRKNYGFPKSVYWAAAKNQAARVIEIAKIFDQSQFSLGYFVPIQTTDKEVLHEMGRLPKSVDTHRETVKSLSEYNVAMLPQIIIGAPGDTIVKFRNVIHELLEWGFHRDICAFLYEVLPNAPANAPEYRQKTKMITVKRRSDRARVNLAQRQQRHIGFAEYIVGHSTMPEQDWVDAFLYLSFIKLFHNLGLMQFMAVHCRNQMNVSYGDFYTRLFEAIRSENNFLTDAMATCRKEIERFLVEKESVLGIRNPEATDVTFEFESYMFLQMHKHREEWHKFRTEFVLENFGQQANQDELLELLRLQDHLLISPDYNPAVGRTAHFNFRWIAYFKEVLKNKPAKLERALTTIDIKIDKHSGRSIERSLQWGQGEGEVNIKAYLDCVLTFSSLRHIYRPIFEINDARLVEIVNKEEAMAMAGDFR